MASRLGQALSDAAGGIHIFGGEPTLELPPNPGRGGRNQHLAVRLSRELVGHDRSTLALVAGTDGSDGPTLDAGGWAGARFWSDAAEPFLAAANAGTYLDQTGGLFTTGPTGTNVMDLVVAVTQEE